MREILFRGKRTDDGRWNYGVPVKCDGGDVIIVGDLDRYQSVYELWKNAADVIPETIGQYAGLTDKNGTKIFEGDIVKCRHYWQLSVYPRDGIDEEEYFFEQKIRGAYGKSVDKETTFISRERYYYFRNYAIEYYAPNGGFRVRNGGQFHALTSSYMSNHSLEVVGNIHDNPELLKGE